MRHTIDWAIAHPPILPTLWFLVTIASTGLTQWGLYIYLKKTD